MRPYRLELIVAKQIIIKKFLTVQDLIKNKENKFLGPYLRIGKPLNIKNLNIFTEFCTYTEIKYNRLSEMCN